MQDTSSVLCKGSLIAQIKVCSKNNPHPSSIISNLHQTSSTNQKIKLKCVMKNSQLVDKKSPLKLLKKENRNPKEQVNFDFFMFFYLDKHDHLEFRQYVKQVNESKNSYSSNFTVVKDIDEFRAKFDEMKRILCHKKFSLIVSQYGMLNYRWEFKDIDEIHFFIPNQQKYSNLSFLMKENNLTSILYDLHNVDKLLQDHNVLKKEIHQNELPSSILLQKLKQIQIQMKTTFGSTGFYFKNQSNKENKRTNPSQCSNSYENQIRVLKSNEINYLRVPKSHKNSSQRPSINLPQESFYIQGIKKNEKPVKLSSDQIMKRKKKSSLTWFKNYSKTVSESHTNKDQLESIYQDEIIQNSLVQSCQNNKQGRFSKTQDVFYKRNNNICL